MPFRSTIVPSDKWNRITLTRGAGRSREVYWVELVGHRDGHFVKLACGRQGDKERVVTATPGAVDLATAEELWGKLAREKIAEGFTLGRVSVRAVDASRAAVKVPSGRGRGEGAFVVREGRRKPYDFGIRQAKVQFSRKGGDGPWLVGIVVQSETNKVSYEDVILHLRDFPVHGNGADVRTSRVEIRLPKEMQGAAALGHWVTNLYHGEHTPTENNKIVVEPAGKRRYRVTWSGRGESMSDRFELDCLAAEVRAIRYS